MRVFPLSPARRIRPDRLIEQLGHPCEVESRIDGLAVAVRVQARYERLDGTFVAPATTDDEIRAALAAHDPDVESAAEGELRRRGEARDRLLSLAARCEEGTATMADLREAVAGLVRRLVS